MPQDPKFNHLGEWALTMVASARGGRPDERLFRAPSGAGETVATAGGFLVPEAFAPNILTTIYADRNSVLPYFQKFNIPEGTNAYKVPGVDETSRANGYRWGGVTADYENEGVAPGDSWPHFKQTEYDAPKLIGMVPVTNELLADTENLGAFLETAFADELRYKLEQYTLSSAGTGTGKPLSVLNSPALITVAATGSQTAGTISYANITSMWSALPSASRKRAIWALSESAMAQADANMPYPVYPPSGCQHPDDVPRIQGRPAIETDVLPICGTPGDILLLDPLWYGVAAKPMASAMSAHVMFINDQAVFRITWRVDGKPLVSAQLTASDGTNRAPYVALAHR
ncbi:phage major capsid protein [Methylovirgula sp. HY1]|uniref:phage major capsid protein n=1 Tax=Methylovirgula sp. HY1 TaxID=2822761 RepID=UPI001C5AE797|nr:phage major capsid protein [Methylovirgula sp. HY1]QXX74245.1 hypothetical protein MHY1_01055 [Methylovirgula sp. HY1]